MEARGDPIEPAVPQREKIDAAVVRASSVIVLGSIMSILDATIVSVALDTLGRTFHTQIATIQWVTTGYLLALGLVIPATGWIIDTFGAKHAWIYSTLLFVCGSVLCGLSWSATSLIVFRVIQGFGGGMILPIGQTIIAREAGPARMGRAMSIVSAPGLIGPILGPIAGGIILAHFSWRFIFFVNVPIGIAAIIAASIILHNDNERHLRPTLDVRGLLLVSPGLALLIFALAEIGTTGKLDSLPIVGGFVASIVLLGGFVKWSLTRPKPLLELRLFANTNYRMATICGALIGGSIYATMFLLPLYYQVVRGQSPLHAALFLIPQACGAMCLTPFAGVISDRVGARTIAIIGLLVMAIGTYIFTRVGATTNESLLAVAQLTRGLGLGLGSVPLQAASYRVLKHELLPAATTLYNILQRASSSVATALVAVILQTRLTAAVPGFSLSRSTRGLTSQALSHVAQAFGTSYWANFGLVALGLVFAILLPRRSQLPNKEFSPLVSPIVAQET